MRKTILKKRCINSLLCRIAVTVCLLFPAINVLSSGTLSAKPVSGKIVSATEEPLIGASIEVQGRKAATVTNIDAILLLMPRRAKKEDSGKYRPARFVFPAMCTSRMPDGK